MDLDYLGQQGCKHSALNSLGDKRSQKHEDFYCDSVNDKRSDVHFVLSGNKSYVLANAHLYIKKWHMVALMPT